MFIRVFGVSVTATVVEQAPHFLAAHVAELEFVVRLVGRLTASRKTAAVPLRGRVQLHGEWLIRQEMENDTDHFAEQRNCMGDGCNVIECEKSVSR